MASLCELPMWHAWYEYEYSTSSCLINFSHSVSLSATRGYHHFCFKSGDTVFCFCYIVFPKYIVFSRY